MDAELLQDFIIEAGELIDGLDGQLVGLEGRADDVGLLNAVFRAFHTVKGGAGFLGLTPLVEICHEAEEVLNAARYGLRPLDAVVMDAVLLAVDEVKRMFDEIRVGVQPQDPDPEVLAALRALLTGLLPVEGHEQPAVAAPLPAHRGSDVLERCPNDTMVSGSSMEPTSPDTISEDEFDALLDQIQARGTPRAEAAEKTLASAPESALGAQNNIRDPAELTLRVAAVRIDSMMNQVGELVLVRNRLAALRTRVRDEKIQQALAQLHLVTSDLQNSVMRLRMVSVGKVFGRFTRVVRDLARQLGKQVELVMEGEGTELDKGMVESLSDPLVHLVRNAVDHGIELPDMREAAGKPAVGRIVLTARQEGSHIVIIVSDDGAGMDPETIRRKAVERGLVDSRTALQMPDEEVLELIFMAGFSTCEAVSEVSGRGVGMDVVRTQITRINGTVALHSEAGRGSRVIIRLPLTLAILPTLMVTVDDRRFALPLPVIDEVIELDAGERTIMDGRSVLSRHGELLPLLDLYRWLRSQKPPPAMQSVLITNAGDRRVGLIVDRLLGQEEVVIKPLGRRLEDLPGFAGATITGDGDIALIIDVPSLYANWWHLTEGDDPSNALPADRPSANLESTV